MRIVCCLTLVILATPGVAFAEEQAAAPQRLVAFNYYQQEEDVPSPSDLRFTPSIEEGLGQPAQIQPVPEYDFGAAVQPEAPGQLAPTPGPTAGTISSGSACGPTCCPPWRSCHRRRCCDDGPLGFGLMPCCEHGEPWRLFPETKPCWGFDVGGWTSAGYTLNDNGASGANANFPVAFNQRGEELLLNQLWFYAVREADTTCQTWDWGFRIDYLFGADAQDTQTFGDGGFDDNWDSGSEYGSALPQLYAEFKYNDFSVIAGHFFTIIGYEVVGAPQNFFYSHANTMNYGEPFTHTGVLTTWDVDEDIRLYNGWVGGWDTFENRDNASQYLGGMSLQLTDRAALTWTLITGDFAPDQGLRDSYLNSFVFTWDINDRWSYVFQHDLGYVHGDPGALPLGQTVAEWYGINQYLFYRFNECWAAGLRAEWFRDDDGFRIDPDGNDATFFPGNYYEVTAGINWQPTANFRLRPEIRWDWFDGAGTPFNNQTEDFLFTMGCDGVLTY